MTAIVVLFLVFDSSVKVLRLTPAVDASARLGYSAWLVLPIGITELICLVLFVIPRTSVLGALLLTGFLGGATANQVRLEDPWFFFPVFVGVLVWGGLYLRDRRIGTLLPLVAPQ